MFLKYHATRLYLYLDFDLARLEVPRGEFQSERCRAVYIWAHARRRPLDTPAHTHTIHDRDAGTNSCTICEDDILIVFRWHLDNFVHWLANHVRVIIGHENDHPWPKDHLTSDPYHTAGSAEPSRRAYKDVVS